MSKGLSNIVERKDGLPSKGVHVPAPQTGRWEVPIVGDPLDQSENVDKTLDVFCQGTRPLWIVRNSNSLECKQISSRISMDKAGRSTYIICTCVSKLKANANGSFCVFRTKGTISDPQPHSTCWRLGVVEAFSYINEDGTDIVYLFEWSGSLTSSGHPAFYETSTFDDFKKHFTRQRFDLHSIDFHFINQVRGNTFSSYPIPDATRSTSDGGIQCNPDGPDLVPESIKIPVVRGAERPLRLIDLSGEAFLVKSTLQSKRKKEQSELSSVWSKSPSRIPPKGSLQCVLLVSAHDGSFLKRADLNASFDVEGLLLFPAPYVESEVQTFLHHIYEQHPDTLLSLPNYDTIHQLIHTY